MVSQFTRRLRRQPKEISGAEEPEIAATPPQFEAPSSAESEDAARWVIQPVGLVVILLLVAGLAAALTGVTAQLPAEIVAQWPWLLIGVGALALIIGLVTAWPHGTLGGPALAAIGLAALMQQSGLGAGGMVLAGVLLVALGLGVGLRGLSMLRN